MAGMTSPSKALLCLHGTGSSGAVFGVQLAKIRLALKNEFDFIFVDGPLPSDAGPGVLPLFADSGPFHCWFGTENATVAGGINQINPAVRAAVEQWESTKKNPDAQIVGVVGFSEGALASVLLLWQQQQNLVPWLPPMRLAALICCYFPAEATSYLRAQADVYGQGKASITVPTLHVHGRRDFCLARARRLVAQHYEPEFANVLEFDGGHHCPVKQKDCEEFTNHIIELGKSIAA